ncbi:MAG: response regulator transcription factor [Candidatus Saccharibacteria bacterium]
MINNHKRFIVVVVSSSELVLAGMAEVLKSSLANEVILLQRGDQIIDYPKMDGNVLVISTIEEQEKNGHFMRQILNTANNIHFLNLQMETEASYSNNTINLNDTAALICFKVNEVLNSFLSAAVKENDTELTRREIEVLQLLCKGYSNKEIADQLFVSTHTVISHRKNISEKTGIKSASGLTMYAILKKIIDVGDITAADLI